MKKYSNLEMEVIALNNEDVLTASGGEIDASKDPNRYCLNSVKNAGQFWDCVGACYGYITDDEVCNYYKNGMIGERPNKWW